MKIKPFLIDSIPTVKITDKSELEGLTLIDVRTPEEFNGELGHIPGAQLVTIDNTSKLEDYLKILIKDKKEDRPLLFICRSGKRSAAATILAQNLGFNSVYNLEGGMILWNQQGLNVFLKKE